MRRLMYVENKSAGLDGPGRIGWVELSKSGRTFHYCGRRLLKVKSGYKYNCIDEETGEEFWVSGPHKDGADKLHGGVVEIDEDARVEYWTNVRGQPSRIAESAYRAGASTRTGGRTRRDERRVRGSRGTRQETAESRRITSARAEGSARRRRSTDRHLDRRHASRRWASLPAS